MWGAAARGEQLGNIYFSYDYIRTHARYRYVINEVEPLPITVLQPQLHVEPIVRPR